jgi:hypothetical protein
MAMSSSGTLLLSFRVGTVGSGPFSAGGGTARGEEEWVLKQNEDYIVKITNNSASAQNVTTNFTWYEHADRD